MKINTEEELRLVRSVHTDLQSGNFRNLFKYLKLMREKQIGIAQNLALNGESQDSILAILSSGLFDNILGWADEDGGSLSQHGQELKQQLEIEKED